MPSLTGSQRSTIILKFSRCATTTSSSTTAKRATRRTCANSTAASSRWAGGSESSSLLPATCISSNRRMRSIAIFLWRRASSRTRTSLCRSISKRPTKCSRSFRISARRTAATLSSPRRTPLPTAWRALSCCRRTCSRRLFRTRRRILSAWSGIRPTSFTARTRPSSSQCASKKSWTPFSAVTTRSFICPRRSSCRTRSSTATLSAAGEASAPPWWRTCPASRK